MDSLELEARILFHTYKRLPLEIDYGDGVYLYTKSGERYLDMFAGIAVNALGHSHPGIIKAMTGQAQKYMHLSNYFVQEPQLKLAALLLQHSGYERVFFSNSGTEATEGGLKIARKYGVAHGKNEIIGFSNGFHGRTMGALSIMDRPGYRDGYGPFLDGCRVLPFNDSGVLRKSINSRTLALVMEFIQGEGGVRPATEEFVDSIVSLKEEYNFILIADEVQTGIGRTGKLFAFEHFNLKPDIVLVAKALGGGLPLGAILGNSKVAKVLETGTHGSTFGGNPVACAAGIVVLEELFNNGIMNNTVKVGHLLKGELLRLQQEFPDQIKEVRGCGLMIGVELYRESEPFAAELRQKQVVVNATDNTVLRIVPPLIINKQHVDEFISAFTEVLALRNVPHPSM